MGCTGNRRCLRTAGACKEEYKEQARDKVHSGIRAHAPAVDAMNDKSLDPSARKNRGWTKVRTRTGRTRVILLQKRA